MKEIDILSPDNSENNSLFAFTTDLKIDFSNIEQFFKINEKETKCNINSDFKSKISTEVLPISELIDKSKITAICKYYSYFY